MRRTAFLIFPFLYSNNRTGSYLLTALWGFVLCCITVKSYGQNNNQSPDQPTDLRVDLIRMPGAVYHQGVLTDYDLSNPKGDQRSMESQTINSRYPSFSWADPDHISRQTAYQLWVSTSRTEVKNSSPACWTSGKVLSNQNINALYTGPALKAGTVYYWKVMVWAENTSSASSVIQAFKTGDGLQKADYTLPSFVLTKTLQNAAPVHATPLASNNQTALYDFGLDAFGQPILKINAADQANILIRLGEKLDQSGHIDTLPPGTVRYRQITLAVSKGLHSYQIPIKSDKRNTGPNAMIMPDYIGEVLPFRYIEVLGNLYENKIQDVIRATVNIPFNEDATRFISADSILNQVWELCKHTIKATSFTGYYIDGDRERIPYEADALINQLSHYSTDASFNMAKRTLDYLIYHPTWPTEWSLQNPLIAYNDYLYSGDLRHLNAIFEQLAPKVLTALEDSTGLISTRTGKQRPEFLESIHYKVFDGNEGLRDIVDWPHTEKETDGFVFTDYNAVVNAFYYRALSSMATIAAALKLPKEATYYRTKVKQVKHSFIQHFLDPSTGLITDGISTDHSSLHANMFALAFGLIPQKNIPVVLDFIKSRGLNCSVYGAQFLLEALGKYDRTDYAIQLLSGQDQRSWYNMLREGATMTMEAWGQSFKPNQDWNHAWGTAPANYIVRYLMGITPALPGFKEVQIKPHPGSLKQASIRYQTIRGSIHTAFHQNGTQFTLTVAIPGNTMATICLPEPYNKKPQLNPTDKPVVTMDGQKVEASFLDGYWIIKNVLAGNHRFTLQTQRE